MPQVKIYKDHWKSYRDLGLIPFPASKGKKTPVVGWKNYQTKSPTHDEFLRWEEKYSGNNVWVLLNGFLVIDPDSEEAEEFVQSLNLPPCPTSLSGNRSVHRWFKNSFPLEKLDVKVPPSDGKGEIHIEVRTGPMGMIVPPSIHPDTKIRYEWMKGLSPWDINFPEMPVEAYEKIKALKNEKPKREWEADSYVEGTRNTFLFKFASSLRAKSVPLEEAKELILEKAKNSDPPLDEKEAIACLKSAYKYPPGVEIPDYVLDFNEKFFVVQMEGKTFVCREEFDDELRRYSLKTSTFADFKNFHSNQRVTVGEKGIGIGEAWIKSEYRRQYEKVVFRPQGETPPNCYNLWKGFAEDPKPGDWSLYEKHLKEIICQGNEEHFQYLIGWMANAIQHPGEQGWSAVVLRGERGAGKGIVAQIFGSLFGQHYLQIFSSRHLVGHFNPHFRDCIFLFVDEAFWAEDKKGESVLKGLVTERIAVIEEKFKNIERLRNRLHIMMATNHERAVPAGAKERRFFVLDVASDKIGDKGYFKKILTQMEQGGSAGLLYDLLKMDLSDFDVRNVPDTEALNDQKKFSMDSHQSYWYELLLIGGMPSFDRDLETFAYYKESWTHVLIDDFYEDYVRRTGKAGISHRGIRTALGMALRKLLPKPYPIVHQVTDQRGGQIRYWEFPPLEECRVHFEKVMKMKIDWEKGIDKRTEEKIEPEEEIVHSLREKDRDF